MNVADFSVTSKYAPPRDVPPPSSNHWEASTQKRVVITATPFAWIAPALIPPRKWIYGQHYIRKFISETIAPGAYGKSLQAIAEALAIVSGRALLGVAPEEQTNVWLWNGEDPKDELQRRIMGACLHFGLVPSDIVDRLFVDTGRETKVIVAEQGRNGAIVAKPVVEEVVATIKANQIGLMIVDPFVASHRVIENDNPAIEIVAATWAEIADRTDCAIELVHHARKTGAEEITVDDGRGGSALLAKVRSARVLNGMTESEAARAGVEGRRSYFRVQKGKTNLTPPATEADWRRTISVDLGNGDSVGVVVDWSWPKVLDGVDVNHLRAVQAKIATGSWRKDKQAKDWAGHAVAVVLGRDAANKADRAKIIGLLARWIDSGALIEVEHEDSKRMRRWFIEVGTPVDD